MKLSKMRSARGLVPLYVGHTQFAAAQGIRQADLKPEEIVLRAEEVNQRVR